MPSLNDLWISWLTGATGSGTGANAGAVNANSKVEDSVHASGDTGDFVLAVRNATTPAALTNTPLDYSPMTVDQEGKQVVSPYAPTDYYWQTTPSTKIDTTDATVKAAAGAGLRNYVTDVTLSNTSATATLVNIKDGATIIHQVLVPIGSTISLSFAIPLKGTANTAVNIAAVTAVTSLIINAQGYIGV